jgi:hypothetical protein
MMEAIRSSETLAPTRATQRDIPEDVILHIHRCENLKFYTACSCLRRMKTPLSFEALVNVISAKRH